MSTAPVMVLIALMIFAVCAGGLLWLVGGNPLVGPAIAGIVWFIYLIGSALTGRSLK